MSMRRLAIAGRTLLARPPRPPSAATRAHSPRLFTQNSLRLLISGRGPRPYLAYLAQPSLNGPQIARLLSTSTGRVVRERAIYYGKVVAITLFVAFATLLMRLGWRMEADERTKPTPEEWSLGTREGLRRARTDAAAGSTAAGVVNWGSVAGFALKTLVRLESPEYDGQDLREGVWDEKALIPPDRRAPYDLSAKSYQWKSGYFEVCMLNAAAAEHLDEYVIDRTRKAIFPRACVIGPSNPDPRPVPPYSEAAPLEENCMGVAPDPDEFYARVLAPIGLTTKQQLEAAHAYGTWLEYKGNKEKAEEAYKWAVNLTQKAMSSPSDQVSDETTAILKESSDGKASENLLRATTGLATFYARSGDVSSALPLLLSVLRARRNAPIDPYLAHQDSELETAAEPRKVPRLTAIWNYLKPPRFPPPPPSGNDPFKRLSEQPDCEDGELMIYIGEILFATGNQAQEGLSWTRQGVAIADSCLKAFGPRNTTAPQTFAELLVPDPTPKRKNAAAERCKDCMYTGVLNWETMLQRRIAAGAIEDATPRETGLWARWFGKPPDAVAARAELEDELAQVAALKDKIVREGIALELQKYKPPSGGTWIG